MADRKIKFAFLSFFSKRYQEVMGQKLVINKYAAQWDADALLESYPEPVLKDMVNRYFSLSDHPSWKGFCRDAQKVLDGMTAEDNDLSERALIKKRAKEWMND